MKQTALITGASGGIGYELALILAQNNFNLVLVARSIQKLEEMKVQLEQKHGIKCIVIEADLSTLEDARMVVKTTMEMKLDIDILINNAGFGDFGLFTQTDWDKELQMINLNMTALTYLTKEYAKSMSVRKRGKIMNVASTAAFLPGPLMAVYYATKAYVLSLSEALANELKDSGITVTALCPGPTASGFQATADITDSKLVKGKKLPTSKEVAEYGYSAMMSGKTVAIHGWINKLQVFSGRFMPRSIVPAIVRWATEKA
jgi:short-subunit dehydrogenase